MTFNVEGIIKLPDQHFVRLLRRDFGEAVASRRARKIPPHDETPVTQNYDNTHEAEGPIQTRTSIYPSNRTVPA